MGGAGGMSGLVARLRTAARGAGRFLGGARRRVDRRSPPAELAARPVGVAGRGERAARRPVRRSPATPDGTHPLHRRPPPGRPASAPASPKARVVVEGNVGDEVGLGMAGGSDRGPGRRRRRGPARAAPEARRGMTGGELVVHGSAGDERRRAACGAGCSPSAARAGHHAGRRDDRGHASSPSATWARPPGSGPSADRSWRSAAVTIPATYRYACTYQPIHLRLALTRLRTRVRPAGRGAAPRPASIAATAATSPSSARERFSHGRQS